MKKKKSAWILIDKQGHLTSDCDLDASVPEQDCDEDTMLDSFQPRRHPSGGTMASADEGSERPIDQQMPL